MICGNSNFSLCEIWAYHFSLSRDISYVTCVLLSGVRFQLANFSD